MPTIISGDTGIDKVQDGAVDLSTDVTGSLPSGNGGIPSQSGNDGKFLTTDGTSASWGTPGGGFSNMEVFETSGTFTVPAGITKVKVTVVGGGGNGGAVSNGSVRCAGGGGGGSAIEVISGLTPGATVSVTVGGAGGTSSFGAYCSATGGASVATNGSTPGDGGIGSGGNLNIGGNPGQGVPGPSGPGGGSLLGGGGGSRPVATGQFPGFPGKGYGGGGGGAACSTGSAAGGAGAAGVVIVEY